MRLFERSAIRIILFLTLSTVAAVAAEPVRVQPKEAGQHLARKADPTLPQFAKLAGGIAGTVVLDVVISSEGRVSSVKAISGHPMLIQSVVNAVEQWEYKPFVRAGHRISVITQVTWRFPSAVPTESEETASRDYYPILRQCYELLRARKPADAEGICSQALELAEQLPPQKQLERRSAREGLANSLFNQHKIKQSIPLYEEALQIGAAIDGNEHDADFAWDNANLGRAYFLAGQMENADRLYGRAVTIFEAAIAALPDMKAAYTQGLQNTLREYAGLKGAEGDPEHAHELENKAAALQMK